MPLASMGTRSRHTGIPAKSLSPSCKLQGPNSSKQRDPSTRQWRYLGKVKGGLFKDIKLIPFDRRVDVPHGVCFNCWEYDHSRQNCPLPDRADHCRNCGRIGVKTRNCPRCSEAYWKYWNTKDTLDQKVQNLKWELAKVRKNQGWKKEHDRVTCLHFSDVEPIPFNTEIDIPCKACGNCWKPFHLGLCTEVRQHEHCFNCGRIGVHMATCPRCFKAYPRYCERKIKDGIDRVLPEVEKSSVEVIKADAPAVTSRLSVFKTFSSALINSKSSSAALQNKDEGYFSQSGSLCNEDTSRKVDNSSLKFKTFSSALIINKSFSAALQDKDEGYSSQSGSLCNENASRKVDNSSLKFTSDYVSDLKTLMESIKHLSTVNQNIIALQFVADRSNHILRIKSQHEKR